MQVLPFDFLSGNLVICAVNVTVPKFLSVKCSSLGVNSVNGWIKPIIVVFTCFGVNK